MKEHSTKRCPEHGGLLLITTSGTQLVCRLYDCNYHERVEAEVKIPKSVARAIRRLRKRTRHMLRKRGSNG